MQTVQVEAREGKKMASFKKLIISKCQSLFELDKAQEMDSAKKLAEINACKDPVRFYTSKLFLMFYVNYNIVCLG